MCAARHRAAAAAAATFLSSCATFNAPHGFLPSAGDAARHVRGGWVELSATSPGGSAPLKGELIATDSMRLWIESPTAGRVWVPRESILGRGQVTLYDWDNRAMAGVTALGVLSTVANGWFFILTTPTWIISSSIAGSAETRRARARVSASSLASLAAYARFPQGMPAGMQAGYTRHPSTGGH
jgi:hypothetical protein